jgi:hypothetical protein
MGAVAGTLYASGHRRERTPADRPAPGAREASAKATLDAVVELIEPDRAALRLKPEKVAAIFLGMIFSRTRPMSGAAEPTSEEIIDVLLHGSAK